VKFFEVYDLEKKQKKDFKEKWRRGECEEMKNWEKKDCYSD